MCGIVGVIAEKDVSQILIECLKKLEYRGYDSAGIATIHNNNIQCIKTAGQVKDLIDNLKLTPVFGNIGIAHTRWATHGSPVVKNAHPHVSHNTIAVIHNGIIENYLTIRHKLQKEGFIFHSDTDTEIVAHLIYYHMQLNNDFLESVHKSILQLSGSFALAILNSINPDVIITVRSGSPVVIGHGVNANFIASDAMALVAVTNNVTYLEEGDIALVKKNDVKIFNKKLHEQNRVIKPLRYKIQDIQLGQYKHFMQKEIFEQPIALTNTIQSIINNIFSKENTTSVGTDQLNLEIFKKVKKIYIVACGSSYHAALTGKYWIEKFARIPCTVDFASEFRYKDVIVEPSTLFVTISQSGETADTLAALKKAKELSFINTLTICNVSESSLARDSDLILITKAGTEISVATTKAFTAQITALLLIAIYLSTLNKLQNLLIDELILQIQQIPYFAQQTLNLYNKISDLADKFKKYNKIFYLARGIYYPIALEGALKLKEISYIPTEAYPAGEMKHGTLALIDHHSIVIAIAPKDNLFKKLKSNLAEIDARKGNILMFTNANMKEENYKTNWTICKIPTMPLIITPIIYTIPLQLLAYHIADKKRLDIDHPKNLAKSVTVE